MDYETFCSGLKVLDKARQLVPFVPLPAQRWRRDNRTPRDIVLKARQGGVSTEEMARSAWVFATVPGATVVTVVPDFVDREYAKRAAQVFERFFVSPAFESVEVHRKSPLSWCRWDGALLAIVESSRSPKSLASLKERPLSRLHAQEAAFWEKWTVTDTLEMGTPSEVVFESTANGRDARFWPMWMTAAGGGSGGYKAHFASWYRCHGIAVTPRNDKERSLLARGVSESQLLWYREKVALHGQAMVDHEYPTDPMDCFGPVPLT